MGTPEMLDLWARKKGITLLGTGDMTHPIWRQELKAKLIPAEQGLFRLKEEYVLPEASRYPGKAPRFVLSGEISSIYKKGGKTRKVHSLICFRDSMRQMLLPQGWKRSEISIQTDVLFWGCPVRSFWK